MKIFKLADFILKVPSDSEPVKPLQCSNDLEYYHTAKVLCHMLNSWKTDNGVMMLQFFLLD